MREASTGTDRGGLLVVGDDGSVGADVAWRWVCHHRWPGWRAEVMTATPLPLTAPVVQDDSAAVEWDSPHPRVALTESELTPVRHLNRSVDPRIMLGERGDADLIVVGPRGLGRIKAVLLGSTTEWLLHHPPAPLAVITSDAPTQRVLLCTDGSDHAQAAVEAYARLPWAAGPVVRVLTVADGRADTAGARAAARASLHAAGVAASAYEVSGPVTSAILDHIDAMGTQLVVLGTRGLTGWARLRFGSTASAVVRAAECCSLVVSADTEPPG